MESILAELPEWARILFYAVLAVGGAIMFIHSKNRPAAAQAMTSGVASIGMELGNKEQIERLIQAVEKVAKAIHDEEQDEFKVKMEHLLEALERAEQRPQR